MAILDNIVSYWKMDEASGNAADSVGANTATNTGVTYAAGKINNGAVFNATTDQFALGNIIPGASDFTISAWVYLNQSVANRSVFDQRNNSNGNALITYNCGSDNKFMLQLRNISAGGYTATTSTNAVSNTTWTYLTVTRSGNTVTHYLNGSANGSGAVSANTTGTDISWIGNFYGGGVNFDGMIDEVGIWSRALTSTEITTLYNAGAGLQYPFTVGNPSAFFQFFN
ncbi:MAG: LamG domain-containing protein [Candidatus Falkowbacteria bacterium]